jgi:hypothetical protein
MLPVESLVSRLINQAADVDLTDAERAAALSAASRIAPKADDWPSPPLGYDWRDGRVVPVEPSGIIPPLRSDAGRWDERAWQRRLLGEEPEADNDNDDAATVPEPVEQTAVVEAVEPMPEPAIEPGRPAGIRRPGSTAATITRLIRRSGGATPEELVAATGSTLKSLRVTVCLLRRDGEDITFDRKTGRYVRAA